MRRNLFIITFISLLNAITLSAIIPIIYIYASKFNLNDFYIGLLFGTFALAQFIATPIIGRLSDMYGRKPLLVISLFGTFIASLIQALSPNAVFLFLGRFIDGVTGGNNSVAQAVITDVTDEKDRPFGFALFGASFGLGFIIGPIISVLLLKYFDYKSIFIFSSILALVATVFTLLLLPETNKYYEKKKINLIELLFLQTFYALKKPILKEILILNFITALSTALFQIAFQPYILNNFGWGQDAISYILVFIGLINIIFIGIVKPIINNYGENKILSIILLFRFLIFLLISLFINKFIFLGTMVIYGFINLFSRPVISTLITKYTKKEDHGVVLGSLESLFSLGLAVGPFLFSIVTIFMSIQEKTGYSILNQYSIPFLLISTINFISYIYGINFIKYLKNKYSESVKKIDF